MKLILGSAGQQQEGWISTDKNELDVRSAYDFYRYVGAEGAESMLVEHLCEHICPISPILKNFYDYLKPKGYVRIAVPDGFHPDPKYIEYVKPPSSGHCELYNYQILSALLDIVGFGINLLEWWDEHSEFHANLWNENDGYIDRCLANDIRNRDGKPHYTSLIIDAVKYKDINLRPSLEEAYQFINIKDRIGLSEYNRRKTFAFYELARLALRGNVIEMGSFHGNGTVPIWYGAMDGNKGRVIAMDSYTERYGWVGEPYLPEDELIWHENMEYEGINPELIKGECTELAERWNEKVSMMMFDLGSKDELLKGIESWEKHFVIGGLIGIRDIDNFSNGTEPTIEYLMNTGRWDKRYDWKGFITSIERIR